MASEIKQPSPFTSAVVNFGRVSIEIKDFCTGVRKTQFPGFFRWTSHAATWPNHLLFASSSCRAAWKTCLHWKISPVRRRQGKGEQGRPAGIFPAPPLAVPGRCGWWRFPPGHPWGTLWQPAWAVKAGIESKYIPSNHMSQHDRGKWVLVLPPEQRENGKMEILDSCPMKPKLLKKKKEKENNCYIHSLELTLQCGRFISLLNISSRQAVNLLTAPWHSFIFSFFYYGDNPPQLPICTWIYLCL